MQIRNFLAALCPFALPFAYQNGERCCNVSYEAVSTRRIALDSCDAGRLTLDSLCCGGHSVECPKSTCVTSGRTLDPEKGHAFDL